MRTWRNCTLMHCQWEGKLVPSLWKTVWEFLKMLKRIPPFMTYIISPRYIPKRNENILHKNLYVHVHSSRIHSSSNWQQPSAHWQMNGQHNMVRPEEYYSATKRSEALTLATLWMDLENTMLNEWSQTQKATQCVVPCMWNVQNRHIHRDRKWIHGCQGLVKRT